MKNRVIVIGIDGGTWSIIAPWCQDDRLKTLKRLAEEGVTGILKSTTPPVTAPAWVSFATGKNPGKHGVFDFVRIGNRKMRLNTSKDVDGRTIYEILSDYGMRSVIIGLPLSFPPKKEFSGTMISDFLYPSKEIYPAEKSQYLKEYRISSDPAKKGGALMKDVMDTTISHINTAKKLLIEEEWDFFFVLLRETDTIFHNFWQDLKSNSPYRKYAIKVFQIVDEFIGWILDQMDENTTLFIISDHGFSDYKYLLRMNKIFQKEGLVTPKVIEKQKGEILEERVKKHSRYQRKFIKLPKSIYRIALHPKISRIAKFMHGLLFKGREAEYVSRVDIERSEAYVPTPLSSLVYVNRQKSNPEKVRRTKSKIESILKSIKIEDQKIVSKILDKDEIYWGPHVDRAPDMFISTDGVLLDSGLTGKLYEPFTQGGYHDHHGIIMVYGKKIRTGKRIKNAKIYDIFPTVLHIIGIPVPDDVDGKILLEIFSEGEMTHQKPVQLEREDKSEMIKLKKTISNLKTSKKL